MNEISLNPSNQVVRCAAHNGWLGLHKIQHSPERNQNISDELLAKIMKNAANMFKVKASSMPTAIKPDAINAAYLKIISHPIM